MRFLEASKNGSFFSGLFHAHHLAQHFRLSSAPEAIPAGKVIPLVSDLAHRHVFFLLFYLRLPLEKRTFAVSERIGSKIFCV